MEMRTNIENVQTGDILVEDVFSLTNRPIIQANTRLKREHIDILKAFLIATVDVESTMVEMKSEGKIEEQKKVHTDTNTFIATFLLAVKQYKKEFFSWQAGLSVNIENIRKLLLPLMEHLEQSTKEILALYHLSNKEEYIYQHSVAVAALSALLAKKMNYKKGEIIQVAMAGCLSDAGMARINHRIFNKPAPLTEEESKEVRNHTKYSLSMLPQHTLLKSSTRLAILQHHERLDGSGYPFGNRDAVIHPYAKIIAVADTFHAMTSERLYRKKQSPFKVIEKMTQDHFGQFELTVLNKLMTSIVNYTIGSRVRLSNGEKATIVFIEQKSKTRPIIKLEADERILKLENNRHLFIEEILEQ